MICPQCQTKYPHGQRFCNHCADENHRPIQLTEEQVDPRLLARYRSQVEQFIGDGFLEEGEKLALSVLRKQFGISDEQHRQILNDYHYRDTYPVRIAYNTATLKGYGAGQQCLVLLRVANLEDMPLKAMHFRYTLNAGQQQKQSIGNVSHIDLNEVSLPFFPRVPGQYTFTMEIEVVPYIGDPTEYLCRPFNFQVFSQKLAQEVHIHQSADNIVGNVKLGSTDGIQGKLLGGGQWGEFKLRPKTNHAVQISDKATILPGLEMMPGMSRCEILVVLGGQPNRKLSLSTKDRVVFGKNKSKSDLRIALEPYSVDKGERPSVPLHVLENNLLMSKKMISNVHFAIYKSGNSVMIEDCRSTNGTLLNSKQMIARRPVELTDGSIIRVGKVLELEVTILDGGSGVLLAQPKHYPQREHLILWGRVGLSNFQRGIIEEFDEMRHQCALEMIDGKACVVNYGRKKLNMAGMKAGLRDGCPVHQGMLFDIGSATVVVEPS